VLIKKKFGSPLVALTHRFLLGAITAAHLQRP